MMSFDLGGARVWVAGHRGMVGSAIVRRLGSEPVSVLTADRREVDLRDERATSGWLERNRPDVVVLAAARVGGIHANDSLPVDFLADNLAIELSVIRAAHAAGVRKLLFCGSSCVYPRLAPQPIPEDALLTGPLEATNQWYAIAKIAGLMLAQAYRRQYGADFVSVMPSNLYGPGDSYDPDRSHVPAALIRRMDEAKRSGAESVTIWGTGRPRREFLYVDDMADACVLVLKEYSAEPPINIGVGSDVTIAEFAAAVAAAVGFRGRLEFDTSKPDGTPRKLLDTSRLAGLGWTAGTPLAEGLVKAYLDYARRREQGLLGPSAA